MKIYYYEVLFKNSYGMCIKSEVENPTKEQVAEFLKKDMENLGLKHGRGDIESVDPISHEDAIKFYDMENEANFPVLTA